MGVMGTLWCRDLPIVSVDDAGTAKPVTLIYPYYENPAFLARQLQHWNAMSAFDKHGFSVIVVDDGSPERPAREVMARWLSDRVRLFEIHEDRRWNWLAARNIGFHHAAEGWCLVTDMDHVVNEPTLRSVINGAHDPAVIYGFSRMDVRREPEHPDQDGIATPIAPHPNSWLMTRTMFWRVGGYDETLSGHYGTDGDWRRRCAATAPMRILIDALLRHEYDGDSSTTRYLRKQPEDAAVKRLVAARKPGWKPKTLSFPYHEVLQESVCR